MIKIICLGKLKDRFSVLEQDYIKKIKHFDKFEIVELKEASGNSKEEILKKEEKLIIPRLKEDIIILSEEGKNINSKEFSSLIENITFVIGSSHGLSENVKDKGKLISLSKMTFNHQLARIILLEQIYRSCCIKNNLPYQRD